MINPRPYYYYTNPRTIIFDMRARKSRVDHFYSLPPLKVFLLMMGKGNGVDGVRRDKKGECLVTVT